MSAEDDYSNDCSNFQLRSVKEANIMLPIGAAMSIFCYMLIFFLYFVMKIPTLQRHPTSLGVRKCFFELVFVAQYLWMPYLPDDLFWKTESDCKASSVAAFLSFVTQFSLIGSELWFLVLTVDLHLASTNPFTSYKLNAQRYNLLVYSGSLGTALILLLLGNEVYGRSSDATCWIQDTKRGEGLIGKTNLPKTFLFYIWMAMIYGYCLYVVLFVSQRLRKGLSETLHTRLSVVRRAQTYVLGYTFFWLFPLLSSFLDVVASDGTHKTFRSCNAAFLSARGIFTGFILLGPNWTEIRSYLYNKYGLGSPPDGLVQNLVQEDLSLRPHLNSALRAEIIYFTTMGIRYAVTESERHHVEIQRASGGNLSKTISSEIINSTRRRSSGRNPLLPSSFNITQQELLTSEVDDFENTISRTFLCKEMSFEAQTIKSGTNDPIRFAALSKEALDGISKLEENQRESITSNSLSQQVDDVLDALGFGENGSTATKKWPTSQSEIGSRVSANALPSPDLEARIFNPAHINYTGDYTGKEFRISAPRNDGSDMSSVESLSIDRGYSISNDQTPRPDSSLRDRVKHNLMTAALHAKAVLRSANNNVPNDFIFKDYMPQLFLQVRNICNINTAQYIKSFESVVKEKFSEGRSGAFLYFSADQEYIVKTTTASENECLLSILSDYVDYLQANPHSLLVKFLGAHSLTMYNRKIHFVVMKNIFSKIELSERYDLKGSWVHRHGDNFQLQRKKKNKFVPLYKDNDLQHKIILQSHVANGLYDQILRDSAFLSGLNLMDYSLLIGVVHRKFEVMDKRASTGTAHDSLDSAIFRDNIFLQDTDGGMHAAVVEGPGTYYMGIIDVLQQWDYSKRLERFFKIYCRWQDGPGLSAINPKEYVDRFMHRAVADVFDGLDVGDDHFVAKKRVHISPAFGKGEDVDQRARNLSTVGADSRFSAAPISEDAGDLARKHIENLKSTIEEGEDEDFSLYSGV